MLARPGMLAVYEHAIAIFSSIHDRFKVVAVILRHLELGSGSAR